MSDETPESIRVIVRDRRARPFFGRHPWVFDSAIAKVESPGDQQLSPGQTVELWSSGGEFIAHGLWNAASKIRVRLYSWNQSSPFGADLITARIRDAVELRRAQFELTNDSTACRLIFSEADQLSGLTVDFYAGYLLVQFTSLALYQFRDQIIAALQSELSPKGVWLRTEKGMREAEGLEAADGLISGTTPPRPLFIEDRDIQYGVDVQEGQKTGCYLDQRDNREADYEEVDYVPRISQVRLFSIE